MSNGVPTSTDKNIVDLTRSHHSRAAAKAVRTTRERLQSDQGVSPAFDVEILGMHLSATLQGAAVMPAVLLLVAGFGTYLKSEPRLFIWAILALSIHALCILVVKRASKAVITPENHKRWRQFLLAGQVAMGCSWAVFATQQCTTCGGSGFVFFKGAVLLLVLSITAMANMLLRQAVLFGFFPTVAALAYISLTGRQMLDLGLTAVFTTALIFFIYITNRLHQANLKLLSFQTEKDDLIAELEVAKSLSDEARRRAEEANMAKSRFLASMSHELRTPLNAILGFSEVMATEILGPLNNPLYKEYAGDIHRSGKHLLELINEILDLSRIEAGKYELSEEVVSLLELAEDGIGMIQLRAKSKNIRIEEQFEQNLPSVWADEKAMRQVVLNLLSNAVKFTPRAARSSSRPAGRLAVASMSPYATTVPAFRKTKSPSYSRPSARARSRSRAPSRAPASDCRSFRQSSPSMVGNSSSSRNCAKAPKSSPFCHRAACWKAFPPSARPRLSNPAAVSSPDQR